MLELRDVQQNPTECFRRIFSDDNFDLIVWYKPDKAIYGFELSYDKADHEKAIRWIADQGLSHYRVDTGEQSPLFNRAAMLVATDGKSEMGRVFSRFEASAEGLPANLTVLIRSKLREYGQLDSQTVKHSN